MKIVIEIPDILTAVPGRDPVSSPDFVALHNIRAGLGMGSTRSYDLTKMAVIQATRAEAYAALDRSPSAFTFTQVPNGDNSQIMGIPLTIVPEVE